MLSGSSKPLPQPMALLNELASPLTYDVKEVAISHLCWWQKSESNFLDRILYKLGWSQHHYITEILISPAQRLHVHAIRTSFLCIFCIFHKFSVEVICVLLRWQNINYSDNLKIKKCVSSPARSCPSVIPAVKRLRVEDYKFKDIYTHTHIYMSFFWIKKEVRKLSLLLSSYHTDYIIKKMRGLIRRK